MHEQTGNDAGAEHIVSRESLAEGGAEPGAFHSPLLRAKVTDKGESHSALLFDVSQKRRRLVATEQTLMRQNEEQFRHFQYGTP